MASRALRAPRELGYRGRQVKAMVEDWLQTKGHAPSYAEIMGELDFCDKACVCRVVQTLERRGLLRRVGAGRVRRIRLVTNNNF